MKAIIEDQTIALEKQNNTWLPTEFKDAQVTSIGDGKLFLNLSGKTFTAILLEINRAEKTVEMLLQGNRIAVQLKEPLDDLLHSMGLDMAAAEKVSKVLAPMPGMVLDVLVTVGQQVAKGDKLLVLEAMKMENIIKATGEGKVAQIWIEKGKTVDKNQVLIEFE